LRYLYTLLFYTLLPFLFLRLLWRSKKMPAYRHNWQQRLGYSGIQLPQCIWIHAVSLGETVAVTPLVYELKKCYPHLPIVMTNMTPTGAARVKAEFGDSVYQCYIPYDIPGFLRRLIKSINPVVAIILETELWPNMLTVLDQQAIPVIVLNARLSEKSCNAYQRIPGTIKQMLSLIKVMAIQTDQELERFKQLGLSVSQGVVTGNLKFDLSLPKKLIEQGQALRLQIGADRPVWIAASTHEGEEQFILAAHQTLLKTYPHLLLILVPRHPDRFDAIFELVLKHDANAARRSKHEPCDATTQIYLGDTTGELMLLYACSDIVFMGGSLVKVGGHNMLEPALLSKAIVTGPYLHNFTDTSQQLIAERGLMIAQNAEELTVMVCQLIESVSERHKMGANARLVLERNRGALDRQLALIKQVIDSIDTH
jgi:3-deoxy-D-manno-octulosonic-acid transferase